MGKGRKRFWKHNLMNFQRLSADSNPSFLRALAVHLTSLSTTRAILLRGFTVSWGEPSWSHSSVWAEHGPAIPVPVHALPLLLPHQFQADLQLHWFQPPKVIDNKSSSWEAARRGVDTATFSIMTLLYISTSISWKLPLTHLQSFWLNMKKKPKPKQSIWVFLHLIQTNMFIFENTTMHTKTSVVNWSNFKLH